MLQYANDTARLINALNNAFIVATLSALVLVHNDFTRDSVKPFQVLGEFRRKCAQVAGRFRQRHAEIDGQTHLLAEREAVWRETRRLRQLNGTTGVQARKAAPSRTVCVAQRGGALRLAYG